MNFIEPIDSSQTLVCFKSSFQGLPRQLNDILTRTNWLRKNNFGEA